MPHGDKDRYHPDTRYIHGRFHSDHWQYRDHIVPPISCSAAYRLETAERGGAGFLEFANPDLRPDQQAPIYIYDRLDEPVRGMLEENLALAEGSDVAVCFATGMAAISGALGVLTKAGDRVIAHKALYGCTYSLFKNWYPRLGLHVDLIDLNDTAALDKALEPDNVMVVYFETPVNPTLDVLDIERIAAQVRAVNKRRNPRVRRVFVVVDNTFATPYGQRPLEHGAHVVVHSLTKNLGGFGTDMGGAVACHAKLHPDLLLYRKDFGAPLAPKSAWPVLVHGLPTLAIRLRQQQATAMAVARHLEAHPAVARVSYPGLPSHKDHELAKRQMQDRDGAFMPGTLLYFVLKGTPEEAREPGAVVINHLAKEALTVTLAVSLGQVRTLVEHPSSMTHAPIPVEEQIAAGIDPGGIRLSFGLERVEDVIADLDRALDAAYP